MRGCNACADIAWTVTSLGTSLKLVHPAKRTIARQVTINIKGARDMAKKPIDAGKLYRFPSEFIEAYREARLEWESIGHECEERVISELSDGTYGV